MAVKGLCLVLVLVLLANWVDSKKKVDYSKHVQAVDNVKDFKKLLRTKINVLVMFGSSQSAINAKMDVFGEAAIASKGTATLVQVDCSTKEGKKLCKKQKVKPDPITIQHYKDGEYSVDYDKKFTIKSILAFLRDPNSDGPWEEEDDAQDVVHVHDGNELNKVLKKKKPTLVMFYAPWCGHCKRFKPAFAEAASELKNKVIFAGVDADSPEASDLREVYNVTGFPKTVYFENGKVKFEYSGGHKKDDVVEWLNDPQPAKEKEPEKGWDEEENDVVHLTDADFDQFIADNSKVLVFFYAPWCGHCKNLKPHWEKAAETLKSEEAPERLTAVDATKFNALANKYKVKGYPTVVYFEDGEEKYDASSAFTRTAEGIVEYIKDPKEPPPPEKEWHEIESDVQHLSDDNFKAQTKKKKHSLVMFYAPWCGHCKKAKPEYMNAASTFADDKKVMFAAVDCTQQKKTCDQYSVSGYPTFYYLTYGKSEVKYQGGREAADFERFMHMKMDSEQEDGDETDDFWEGVAQADLLHHVTKGTWESFVSQNAKVLLVIYDSACPNCQVMKGEIAKCAGLLQEKKIPVNIAALRVDINEIAIPHLWTSATGVPTLYWFRNGVKETEYEGPRSAEAMLKFVKSESDVSVVNWSEKEFAEDVYHLDDQGFKEFINENDEFLTFFYSPVSSVCQQIQPKFAEAATLLQELKPEVSLVAVNIRKASDLKTEYKVRSTPKFVYFKNGKKKYEYYGRTEADDFVDFMMKPTFIEQPKVEDGWFLNSNVTHLNKGTLLPFVKEHSRVLVMFYAPWCGHCKKFKPEFSKAAGILMEEHSDAKLAAINGNEIRSINSKYDVKGFPTLLFFKDHEYTSHYKGARSAQAVVDFILKSDMTLQGKVTESVDVVDATRPEVVALLDPDNLQVYVDEHKHVLVMFYAPWCGACKKARDPFYEAAYDIDEDLEDANFAIFNAYQHREFADSFVKGYPTFWYFEDGKRLYKYTGGHTKDGFVDFMTKYVEYAIGKETEGPTESTQWISEVSHVKHLSRENFDRVLQSHESVMVFFYINACEHCINTLKPRYVEAASLLAAESSGTVMAAINGDWEKSLAKKYDVNAFPAFLYFRSGQLLYKYQGPTDVATLVRFMKNPTEDLAKRKKPTSWQDLPGVQLGRIQPLSNLTYESFIKDHELAVVMFHSVWYPKCVITREEFRDAGNNIPTRIGMGAVDCHRKPEQGIICYNLKVKKFPSFKFYSGGAYVSEFDVKTRLEDELLLFLSKQAGHDEL